jgi:hypothetical protein
MVSTKNCEETSNKATTGVTINVIKRISLRSKLLKYGWNPYADAQSSIEPYR